MAYTLSEWSRISATDALREREAHVWQIGLEQPPEAVTLLRRLLSPDELERADRFHFPDDRRAFAVCRGVARRILGRELGVPAHELRFTYSAYGKPDIAPEQNPRGLRFNISHSGGVALCALAYGRRLGVDIERVREDLDYLPLSARFFAPDEHAALLALPGALRRRAFFACWTRKEAYIKARGEGLSFPLESFSVSLGSQARLLRTGVRQEAPATWRMAQVPAAPDFMGALAVEVAGAPLDALGFGQIDAVVG
ncbi:4'-phosphopantetheinyl transferase superfamily protein [Chloroflexia bacterium SDU3-3]|nr:4'-phosphopantetheinyl transferase superfamily protein [Chloroflexia bacterium SDU3-3]